MSPGGAALVPLHLILVDEIPAERRVAVGPPGGVTWADLRRDLAGLIAQVRQQPTSRRWALCCDDAYGFTVGWLALIHEGCTVVLPPNGQPGTLAELADKVEGFLVDGPAPAGPWPTLHPLGHPPGPPVAWQALPNTTPVLELFTSGTTGQRKAVPKTLAQLAAELASLESLWGAALAPAAVLASVTHQHIYGLLFRVLWPLVSGRPFLRRAELIPEALSVAIVTHAPCLLVSRPAHLERLPELVDLTALRPAITAVFSSASSLPQAVARRLADLLGQPPIEVLGSTETGGVAWRQQDGRPASDVWQALPGVQVRAEGEAMALTIHSPFVTGGDWFSMGDQIELLSEGRFRLLGRYDRIVKLGGQRLALPELEERLRAHPWVAEAAAVPLLVAGRVPRQVLGCVVCLTAAGRAQLAALGHHALGGALRQALGPFYAAILLPKRWRFVGQVPVDAQGKASRSALQALFAEPVTDRRELPEVTAAAVSEKQAILSVWIPPDLYYLRGHFPTLPVVPGVAQLKFIMAWAAEYLGLHQALTTVELLKFHQMMSPGDQVTVELNWQAERHKLNFRIHRGEQTLASGRLVLAATEAMAGGPP